MIEIGAWRIHKFIFVIFFIVNSPKVDYVKILKILQWIYVSEVFLEALLQGDILCV